MTGTSLVKLLAGLPGARRLTPGDPAVSRVVCDSRQVGPGDLFVAVRGVAADGHDFLEQAVRQGAVAVVVERPEAAPEGVEVVCVPDAREAVACLAHLMAGSPTDTLTVCGVTGTNGKTTTTYLARSILQAAGRRVGLLGTISYQVGGRDIPAPTTTPGPVELAGYLADLVRDGCDTAVMEVSSHALDQRRTAGVRFRVAAFTNLTPEHQDYHKDMPSYRRAKGLLFAGLGPDAVAVLNRDDEASQSFADATAARRIIWYSKRRDAEVAADRIGLSMTGTRFRLRMGDERIDVALRLLGDHNVYNAMTAAGIALALGIPGEHVRAGLEAVGVVPGRLETVDCGQPFAVLVDYAHQDDALERSLETVASLPHERIIVVFGCGGDRDRTKRPRMAEVAERLADVVIVTSDNPRTEDPEAIIKEIFTGFELPGAVIRQPDREAAIGLAIETARPGDAVVIAGKGHETYQIVGAQRRDFDDRRKAREALAALGYKHAGGGGRCT